MMLTNPRMGQPVQIWYRADLRPLMPYQGMVGRVVIAGHGKPRNHGIEIDGQIVIIPAGNLVKHADKD